MAHASGVAPDPGRKCILHVGKADETTGNITPITEDHWSSIINVAARRRQKRNFVTSKYYTIIQSLPDESDSSHGYHVNRYKNFTAVPRDDTTEKTQTHASSEKTLRSSCDFAPSTSTSGIFPRICLFCKKARKKKGGREEHLGECETLEAEIKIKTAAADKKDNSLLGLISGVDFRCKEVRYHHSCRSTYLSNAQSLHRPTAIAGSISLLGLYAYIEKSVIFGKRPELLTSIFTRYQELCEDAGETPISTARNLATNLQNKFGDIIRVECKDRARKAGAIVYPTGLGEHLIHTAYDYAASPEAVIHQAALLLRKAIKHAQITPLPEPPTLQNLYEGEVTVPDMLIDFFQVLYGGPNQNLYTPKLKRRALSSS
uniref:uncharacterized protein n=1 Tax=Myxine glutinosa TaxID=7769 RepID=UPI00358DF5D0